VDPWNPAGQLVASLNGLAALALVDGDCTAAVALYRRAVATADANKAVRAYRCVLTHVLVISLWYRTISLP
jgi:hypothetical protein